MYWVFIILAAIAIAFTLLGALSVWATVLFLALKTILIAVPAVLVAVLLWQRFIGRRN